MNATSATLIGTARTWRSEWQRRWRDATPTTRTRVQVGVFLTVILVAYHYSLSTLFQTLDLETPLAYLGLVPLIALGLAALRSRPSATEPQIYDRQVDYIVGVPLMLSAVAINLLLPKRLSAMFWIWRIDLLSFPFFVAGVATVVFGIRAVWRQRLAIGYLFLAWPLPYTDYFLKELNAVTTLTLSALTHLVHVIRVATPIAGSSGSIFSITHHGASFQLSVVSACSGVNGMVGFLLVGIAFGALVKGPFLHKTLWLAGGIALLWAINLGRLMLIFWTGKQYGEHFAVDVLHPFVGLVTFNLGVLAMLLMLRPAGLSIKVPSRFGSSSPAPLTSGLQRSPLAVPSMFSAVAVVAVMGLVLGVNNSGLRAYDLVAAANGEPKLTSYLHDPASPHGWAATFATQYTFAQPYFGESSLWYRYTYSPVAGPSNLSSSLPVVADVINTSNPASFDAYGVDACYKFHGYSLHDVRQVGLGGGITGQALSYTTGGSEPQDWSIVYWIWPVLDGSSTRYERVILYLLGGTQATIQAPGVTLTAKDSAGAAGSPQTNDTELSAERGFLTAFAREVIQAQGHVPAGAQLGRSVQLTGNAASAAQVAERARERAAQKKAGLLPPSTTTTTSTTLPSKVAPAGA